MKKDLSGIPGIRLAIGIVSIVFIILWLILGLAAGTTFTPLSVIIHLAVVICFVLAAYLDMKYLYLAFPISLIILGIAWRPYYTFWYLLAGVILLVCLILWILPDKKNNIHRFLWIGAAVVLGLFLIRDLVYIIQDEVFDWNKPLVFRWLVEDIYAVAITVLTGMWIQISEPTVMTDHASPVAQEPDISSKVERLNNVKMLLDSGIITQEEFDNKKAEILGTASVIISDQRVDDESEPAPLGEESPIVEEEDERIKSLKALVESGFLTQEEFEEKKKGILGMK